MSLQNIKGKKLEAMFANMQTKKMDTEEKISKLNEEDKRTFANRLINNLRDEYWCKENNMDHADPNFGLARKKTYQEIYERK